MRRENGGRPEELVVYRQNIEAIDVLMCNFYAGDESTLWIARVKQDDLNPSPRDYPPRNRLALVDELHFASTSTPSLPPSLVNFPAMVLSFILIQNRQFVFP